MLPVCALAGSPESQSGAAMRQSVSEAKRQSGVDPSVEATSFRVENRIYVGSEKRPRFQSVTLFDQGRIFDYLDEPREVTLFDQASRRFVLLNLQSKIKTEVSTDLIDQVMDKLTNHYADEDDPYLDFLYHPEFQKRLDSSSGAFLFEHPRMSYRVYGKPLGPEKKSIVHRYRVFADWYAKLNTFLRPQSRPPFARLIVNEQIERQGWIPTKIHLTVTPKTGLTAPTSRRSMRSEHQIALRLSEADLQRIAQTEEFLSIFSPVSLTEYQEAVSAP